ncbi:hypothetical protein RRG08_046706 [Elysia crispata]|uniref:Uncharacterized protein n=1 Tax=Elysia crispata TaxID=231223 RepID=A0AAE1DUX4_9GAST|nr:hypothetical protein RRG08_046706 [Elysia crispata]
MHQESGQPFLQADLISRATSRAHKLRHAKSGALKWQLPSQVLLLSLQTPGPSQELRTDSRAFPPGAAVNISFLIYCGATSSPFCQIWERTLWIMFPSRSRCHS